MNNHLFARYAMAAYLLSFWYVQAMEEEEHKNASVTENQAKIEYLHRKAIVILKGTSSAGKSSVCDILTAKYGWKTISEDEYAWNSEVEQWKSLFADEYRSIAAALDDQNVYHAVRRKQICFKPNIGQEIKDQALKAMETIRNRVSDDYSTYEKERDKQFEPRFLGDINTFSDQGFTVIIESWGRVDKWIDQLSERYFVCSILMYVPLRVMLDRTKARNAESFRVGNLRLNRLYNHALRGFWRRYRISPQAEGSVDILTTEDAAAFDKVTPDFPLDTLAGNNTVPFIQKELTDKELVQYKKQIIDAVDQASGYVTPRISYDFLIRSHEQSLEDCALAILTYSRDRSGGI